MGPLDWDLLQATLIITAPILLIALGEVVSERAGVLNVGLEGMVLVGAFGGFLVAWQMDSRALGVAAGTCAGILLATLMALLSVEAKVDQIVAGVALNILAIGVTTFAYDQILGGRSQVTLGSAGSVPIPFLSGLGGLGHAIFDNDIVVYLAFAMVPALALLMTRTRWGVAIRSVGEKPEAADTAGISVRRVRWMAVLFAGALAGLAGAYLSVIQLGIFRQEMSAGRGFLALAAVIFGRWKPGGVAVACLMFGAADALQLRLQGTPSVPWQVWAVLALGAVTFAIKGVVTARMERRGNRWKPLAGALVVLLLGVWLAAGDVAINLPAQIWLALPPILALGALAISGGGRARMPSALTIPYRRGSR